MRKSNYNLLLILSSLILSCFGLTIKANGIELGEQTYIFFLHNKFAEENSLEIEHPEYGKVEYNEIIQSFIKDGFIVFSEIRKPNTDVKTYAKKIGSQIDSLLKKGIKPDHITVIGTSKGGYIAQFISTYMANPEINYVFIGCYQESDLKDYKEINYCGNILTIYEKSDSYGVSAIEKMKASKLKINRFKEIELNTDMKHGFLFKSLKEWTEPCKMWAKRNYELNFK